MDQQASDAAFSAIKEEILTKIQNVGIQMKLCKDHIKLYQRALENLVISIMRIDKVNFNVGDIVRWNRPKSRTAQFMTLPSRILLEFEQYRYEQVNEFVNVAIPEFETMYEKLFVKIRNYTRSYEIDENERLLAIKKAKANLKKTLTKRKRYTDVQMNEIKKDYDDKCYDMKQLRTEYLSKLMTDENVIYSEYLNLNLNLLKYELISQEQFSMAEMRRDMLTLQNLISNANSLPAESGTVLNNIEFYGQNLHDPTFFSSFSLNNQQLNSNTKAYVNVSKPIVSYTANPRVATFQYISTSKLEMDLIEGDLIICLTGEYDGWQYGINMETERKAWFPVLFTSMTDDENHSKKMKSYIEQRNTIQ